MAGMKVVIDTNIWISFLFGKLLSNLVDLLLKEKVEIITSDEQISELFEVIAKPKIIEHISNSDLQRLFHFITTKSKIITIKNKLHVCRDPKDDFKVEMAIAGNAEIIITGDKDLLDLNPYQNIRIIT